jgi:hypothetical protein
MADFIPTTISKNAVRVLRTPLASLSAFTTIVNGVVSGNPWGCIPYTRAGMNMPPVEITRQVYSGKVIYQDVMGKTIGTITVSAPSQSGFTSAIADVVGNSTLEGLMGGIAVHDPIADNFSNTVRCCAADGDLFNVTFTRKQVRVASYNDDGVLATLETWADGVPALG